jgi:hypothetical protein
VTDTLGNTATSSLVLVVAPVVPHALSTQAPADYVYTNGVPLTYGFATQAAPTAVTSPAAAYRATT